MRSNVLKSLLGFLVLLSLVHTNYAQGTPNYNVRIRYLGPEDGLAGKQVNCGMQDSQGFIWLGTTHGLQRYDGKIFKLYSKEKNHLQDNNVVGLCEDGAHRLWITYGLEGSNKNPIGKVDIMDLNTGIVRSLTETFNTHLPFEENTVGIICANEKKELILVTTNAAQKNDVYLYRSGSEFKSVIK